MAESRNRPGHHYQKPADVPSKQRVKGRVIWAILFAIFGLLMAYFATGDNYLILAIAAIASAAIGFIIGKNMEQDAAHKA